MRNRASEILIKNLATLLAESGKDVNWLVQQSGVSKRMIQYIMKGERVPSIEILSDLAGAFGLEAWVLLVPGPKLEFITQGHINRLMQHYARASTDGRAVIEHIAEIEAGQNQQLLPRK